MHNLQRCHFIGIGGIGMSGLAHLLIEKGIHVTGSDVTASPNTDKLEKLGAKIFIGHSPCNVDPTSTVVYSTDIKLDNLEYQRALTLKCPLLHRSDLLNLILLNSQAITVTGTHGKTTTSSLLSWVLTQGGLDPSCLIGGIVVDFESNARKGNGEIFVAEADESDGSFLKYSSWGAIVTNIGLDHLSHYKTEEALVSAFETFMHNVISSEHLFWCGDDLRLTQLNPKGISYGFEEKNILKGSNIRQIDWRMAFDIHYEGKTYYEIEVSLIGHHNALNALAVFGMALKLGLDEGSIRSALKLFRGVKRRCEKKGEAQGIMVIDDYGHHPTEIQTTLEGIRKAIGNRRLIAVFQPHRYTRTRDCLGMYGNIFNAADLLVLTDIYGGGEIPIPGITHEKIWEELSVNQMEPHYFSRNELETKLRGLLRPQDVVVTLGAGDLNQASSKLAKLLETEVKTII